MRVLEQDGIGTAGTPRPSAPFTAATLRTTSPARPLT
jgi:hypothetical protein